ncbi:regulatory GntR family protein [Micromonospora pisi]|uniref:Regulatory GntR family protein n=1 Tax=Micromonospora pisi TaxID=589240 RepID=A0A495JNF5_9ACTN|nr:regulatory GntR family protein [Micromonospora pisi]
MPASLYQQISNDIANQINSGAFKPGDRIPSTRQLEGHRGKGICVACSL